MLYRTKINWSLISEAIYHYSQLGFKYIEVPWVVEEEYSLATKPPENSIFKLDSGEHLVGSAEQAFIQEMDTGLLKPGRYQTVTPCFRKDQIDDLHTDQFMKVELIEVLPKDYNHGYVVDAHTRLLNCAESFFLEFIEIYTTKVGEGLTFDILAKKTKIELGSYGFRTYKDYAWIYGTGLAEPRFSKALIEDGTYLNPSKNSKAFAINK